MSCHYQPLKSSIGKSVACRLPPIVASRSNRAHNRCCRFAITAVNLRPEGDFSFRVMFVYSNGNARFASCELVKSGPILLVDDDGDDRQLVESVCRSLQYKNPIVHFENGLQLVDYLRATTEKPFLILCDINMPLINGLELRRKIDEDEALRRKSIPFVFFSTKALQREVTEAYELTVQGFFEKGDNLEQLTVRLRLILEYWTNCHHPNAL